MWYFQTTNLTQKSKFFKKELSLEVSENESIIFGNLNICFASNRTKDRKSWGT